MDKKRLKELNDKIGKLERKRMEYLEVDNKASVRRLTKQIENIEQEIELSKYEQLKQKLRIYKRIISNYPMIKNEIKYKLLELKIED